MKKLFLVVFLCTAFLFIGNPASAYNILQLDIWGGTYSGDTTYGGPSGDLYAFLNPDSGQKFDDTIPYDSGKLNIDTDFYLVLSVVPSTGTDPGIDPNTIFSNSGYTVPSYVSEGSTHPSLLPPHAPFDTYHWIYQFNFVDSDDYKIDQFNAQTYVGPNGMPDPDDYTTGDPFFYYAKFNYDVSALLAMGGIDEIHFDLYGYDEDGKIYFAPFSHDASAVPEPATLLLLGGGLVGLAGFGRKRFKK